MRTGRKSRDPPVVRYGTDIDDVVAVLDDAQVGGVGIRHLHRVQAMILDSPLLSNRDIEAVRG